MTSATNQLLVLSREDAGITPAAHSPVRLDLLLQDTIQSLQPLADAKNHQLVADIDSHVVVLGDEERWRQVLENLLDNAIKYTPEGGRIQVTLAGRGNEAVLTIEDNGIGIAPEHLPHIFERFYRVNKSAASHDDGAGLGLSIVHSIVSSFDGRVEVDSSLGKGSRFRILIPADNASRRVTS